ncbi:MAG: autotransporter-associated beta strand repeat-containing protein [Akkermansiaceae bacterium]|nr:autotransporter-associated beta strand repeat-containing protein [Akkermansiaceae bacterium]
MKAPLSNPFIRIHQGSRTACFTAATLLGTFSATAADVFWDINGDVAGPGGIAPSGNWEDANWSTSGSGEAVTSNWAGGGDVAVFSAGTEATDPFTVTTSAAQAIAGINVEEGTPTIDGTGSLSITDPGSPFRVISNAFINVPITGTGGIRKVGSGTLNLLGNNSFSGGVRIEGGKVVLGGNVDVISGGLTFGWNNTGSVQDLDIIAGADVTVDRFVMADWYYTENTVSQSGGTLNITGSNDNGTSASFLLGHWGYGSTCVYGLSGGTLNSPSARLSLGWDRSNVQFNQSGGTANINGINLANGRNNTAAYNLTGGRLNLGAGGINNASNKSINAGGATLGAFSNWTSTKSITLTGDITVDTLDSADGVTERVISLHGSITESTTAGITKVGAGTLSLSGTVNYSGDTVVDGGTLLPGANLPNSKIIVNSGGSLGAGTSAAPGVSLVSDVDLDGGNLGFRVGTAFDTLDVLTLNVISASTVSVIPSQALTVGQEFPVLKYSSLTGLGLAGLSASLPNPHYSASVIDDPVNSQVIVKIDSADELIWTGSSSAVWDVNTTANWKLGSALPSTVASNFYEFDVITFDDSSAVGNVTLSGSIKPASMVVDNSVTDYSFTGSPIAGGTSLTKFGSAKLSLPGSNTFSGDVNLQEGRVVLGTATSLGTGTSAIRLGPGAIVEPATSFNIARNLRLTGGAAELEVNTGITTTLTAPLKGGGTLTKSGEGTLAIQGYSSGNGFEDTGIVVEAGRLVANTGAFNADLDLPFITVEAGAELVIPSGVFHALGGAFTASPIINLNGGLFTIGQEQYLDKINMTGATINANGANPQIRADYAFELKTFASGDSSIINGVNFQRVNSNFLFNVEDGAADEDLVFNSTFDTASNTFPITKTGAGVMVITGTQSYTGATNVNGGTLVIEGSLGNTAVTVASTAVLSGDGAIAGPVSVLGGGAISPSPDTSPLATGSLSIAGAFDCEIDGIFHDKLEVEGDLDLTGGTLNLTEIGGGATEPTYVIATYTGTATGNFATVNGLPPGYSVQIKAATKEVVVTTEAADPYDSWESINGITGAGGDVDSDGDGVPNGVEFVIGGDPSGPGSDSNGLLPTIGSDATYLIVTYRRTDDSVSYGPTIQYGSSLGAWTTAVHGVDGVVITETNDGFGAGIDSVEVKIPRALAVDSRLFARLRIVIP